MNDVGAKSMTKWLAFFFVFLGMAGCGPGRDSTPYVDDDPSRDVVEESRRIYEKAAKEHLIGYDSTGFPVYGVDEEGKPIYKRDK